MIFKTHNSISSAFFWCLCAISAALVFAYLYFMYASVYLSYQIENELNVTKQIDVAYQNLRESYIAKLENMLADGQKALGLIQSKNQIFIERYQGMARAGL